MTCLNHVNQNQSTPNTVNTFWSQWLNFDVITTVQTTDCIQGKFCPLFIIALFALWPEGELKTELIALYTKDYIRKLESGRIQDWANQSQKSMGRK